jgi:DNA invertase Pin-like site-specific DNA recombinase
LNILEAVKQAGAGFRSLKDAWCDTTTPHGVLMLTVMRGYRAWLAQLPADQARNVAHANAERLFGGKVGE